MERFYCADNGSAWIMVGVYGVSRLWNICE